MQFLTIISILLLSIISIKCQDEECVQSQRWKDYKTKHNVNYDCEEKERIGCQNFEETLIQLVNVQRQRADLTYTVGVTSAMHINFTNYKGVEIDNSRLFKRKLLNPYKPKLNINQIPKSFNWVDQGFKTPVQHQGDCASCYSFSAAGGIEGQNFICNKDKNSLSEQYFLDCSPESNVCGRGDPARVVDLAATAAIPYEKDYPYIVGKCTELDWAEYKYGHVVKPQCISKSQCNNKNKNGFTIDTVEFIGQGNEDHLLIALYEVGPILVATSIGENYQTYKSGVYDPKRCNPNSVEHAVLLVGYTPDYYIIKNSLGDDWGENGYMKLKRKSNTKYGTCAILFHAQAVRKNGCRNV